MNILCIYLDHMLGTNSSVKLDTDPVLNLAAELWAIFTCLVHINEQPIAGLFLRRTFHQPQRRIDHHRLIALIDDMVARTNQSPVAL